MRLPLPARITRIELFGRRERPGPEYLGNELLAPDAQPFLPFADGALDEALAVS